MKAGRPRNIGTLNQGSVYLLFTPLGVEGPGLKHAMGGDDVGFAQLARKLASPGGALFPEAMHMQRTCMAHGLGKTPSEIAVTQPGGSRSGPKADLVWV